jgi:hypothetical protein
VIGVKAHSQDWLCYQNRAPLTDDRSPQDFVAQVIGVRAAR